METNNKIKIVITLILSCIAIILISQTYISIRFINTGQLPYIIGFSCIRVTTSNMEPYIDTGDIIIISKNNIENLQKGEIVSYIKNGIIVIDKVIDFKSIEGKKVYLFEGDANNLPDTEWIPHDDILGIYQLKIHKLVKIVNILRSPFLIIIIISLLSSTKLAKLIKRQLRTLRQYLNKKNN